jgi:acetyl-CoA carboxylase carboxyl transferase subunit alpha
MSKRHFLEFEQPIAELESKIDELRYVQNESAVDISEEIDRLSEEPAAHQGHLRQPDALAGDADRAPPAAALHAGLRREVFTDFQELHGDRHFADDLSIVGGLARFNGQACMVLGHQKGRDTKERTLRNFGMSRPEGYRKALRLMKLAEKFGLPVFTFVDTPGAYPGIGAEERGQSEAIGRNIFEMAQLEVPIVSTIIGEGGSGGALAISVADQVLMLQFSVYSVISPEGCASILWKTAERASDAAEALGITAHRLKALGVIDKIVNEPVGGAHRDPKLDGRQLKRALNDALRQVADLKPKELLQRATSGCSPTAASPTPRTAERPAAPGGGRQRRPRLDGPAACTCRPRGLLGLQVVALHVHHGLHARGRCLAAAHRSAGCGAGRRGGFRCLPHAWTAAGTRRQHRGLGPRERYAALAAMAREAGCDTVLLAHHRRDQAETCCCRPARRRPGGAGGHAAQRPSRGRDVAAALAGAAARGHRGLRARHRLGFVDDGSNADPALHATGCAPVWPALRAPSGCRDVCWPGGAGARRKRLRPACELAALDLADPGRAGQLDVAAWLDLSRRPAAPMRCAPG